MTKPEELARLGQMHIRTGDRARGRREIAHAHEEPGADAERACSRSKISAIARRTALLGSRARPRERLDEPFDPPARASPIAAFGTRQNSVRLQIRFYDRRRDYFHE